MPHKMALYLHWMHRMDSTLCIRLNRTSHNRGVRRLFRLVSRLGDGLFWYAVMLGIVLGHGSTGILPTLHMALVGMAGAMLYKWLKQKTLRPRPYEVHQDIWLTGIPLDRFSFPSGHTLHAVAFTTVALVYYPALASLLVPFAVLVGMSRIVLGLHYPSDVLAGALLGLSLAALSFAF